MRALHSPANVLDGLLGLKPVLPGDLILTEVLQGFRNGAEYNKAPMLLDTLELRMLGGHEIALTAANNYRALRRRGITPRETIDMIIGTYCIENRLELLHSDRDFDVLEKELGLLVVKA